MACFQKLLSIVPTDDLTRNNMAHTYSNLGEHSTALRIISEVCNRSPDDHRYLLSKGLILYRSDDFKEAVRYFKETIGLKNNSYEAHFYRGMAHGKLDKEFPAMNSFKEAIKINSNDFNVWFNLGISNDKLGRPRAALVCFNIAIRLYNGFDGVYFSKGVTLQNQNKIVQAIQNYSKAIELNPYNTDSIMNLATCYSLLDRFSGIAIDYIKRLLELNPTDVEALFFLAHLYFNRGTYYRDKNELSLSLIYLDKVLKLDSQHFGARDLIDECCLKIYLLSNKFPNVCQ